MRCIYFDEKNCLASLPNMRLHYEPTDADKKAYCEQREFPDCPRLKAFAEYLQAINATKRRQEKSK